MRPLLKASAVVASGLAAYASPQPVAAEPPAKQPVVPSPIRVVEARPALGFTLLGGKRLCFVRGGRVRSAFSQAWMPVRHLIDRERALGGVNAGYFCGMPGRCSLVGGVLSEGGKIFLPATPRDASKCRDRPLVLWGRDAVVFTRFRPEIGLQRRSLDRLLPGATDAFVGGAWLVHGGKPVPAGVMSKASAPDISTRRLRAAAGIDSGGRWILAASEAPVDAATLAKGMAALGAREAVLLDGGLSTALVWRGLNIVNGDNYNSAPSRPVPHALVVFDPVQAKR